MIKIQNEQGKTLFKLEDDATEPEPVAIHHCSKHGDYYDDPTCKKCKKEGELDAKV